MNNNYINSNDIKGNFMNTWSRGFKSTNYHKLDDFEDYVEEFNEGEHFSKFEKINVGIKIMPSYNLEKNILYMRHSKDVSKNK